MTTLAIVGAEAISIRTVRVTLSATPRHGIDTQPGDALNPSIWSVVRLDTGDVFTVLHVDQVTPTLYDVTVLETFANFLIDHQVSTAQLTTPSGALLSPPRSWVFPGVVRADMATLAATVATKNVTMRDIANPPLAPGSEALGGTLQLTAGGDYATEDGPALVRKLVIRRLVTPTGGFAHLPGFGIGLPFKQPVPVGDLGKLRVELERQVLLEPEVQAVVAQVSLKQDILTIVLQVRLRRTGASFSVPFTVSNGIVVFK